MKINRVAAQKLIKEIPADLRKAARAERKKIAKDAQQDPIGTSLRASYGYYNTTNNFKYTQDLIKLKEKIAQEQYSSNHPFIQRQPYGSHAANSETRVIKASTYLGE